MFATPEDGFLALQIWIQARGHWTLKKAVNTFAPQVDFNNTNKYIKDICKKLGCKENTLLNKLNTVKLMNVIANLEGYKFKKND